MRGFVLRQNSKSLGFEVSPRYLSRGVFHLNIPTRIRRVMPENSAIIVILRDPADRATWSDLVPHWVKRIPPSNLTRETLGNFPTRDLNISMPFLKLWLASPRHSSCAGRASCTFSALRTWTQILGRERFFFAPYERLFGDAWETATLLNEIVFFLGLEPFKVPAFQMKVDSPPRWSCHCAVWFL